MTSTPEIEILEGKLKALRKQRDHAVDEINKVANKLQSLYNEREISEQRAETL